MNRSTSLPASIVLAVAVLALAACGGGGNDSSSSGETQTADFVVAKKSDVGLRDGYATFTSRSDGKTSAVVDFSIERTEDATDDVYAVAVRSGSCESPGDVTTALGDATNGMTTLVVDKSFDDIVGPLKSGEANVVIAKKGGAQIDWCGASETSG